ncbi:rhodanese-like domain-containing protein [Spongiactinospora sp. TRM90649]|uniref:rhodanese-like domain-containing protein n=1 Tax=Spongiactinospora sp. TRM90649 TaxID=3031114 RepID=UPI0023F6F058|nr:rhodanese-like domain-containing protein [Spongiactinospora sp. TRM90649]MDF5758276.1 rhodanese-like domain-containing protein [Spongiactinospora sp. TRM90649]
MTRRTIDDVLAAARARLSRLTPEEAAAAMTRGGLLVDTRPAGQREEGGEVPGAVVIDRNVLEWRLDPASPHRLPVARDHALRIIVMCRQGYSSSLAAASLQDLGLRHATDMTGGFDAWAAAGLPVRRPR